MSSYEDQVRSLSQSLYRNHVEERQDAERVQAEVDRAQLRISPPHYSISEEMGERSVEDIQEQEDRQFLQDVEALLPLLPEASFEERFSIPIMPDPHPGPAPQPAYVNMAPRRQRWTDQDRQLPEQRRGSRTEQILAAARAGILSEEYLQRLIDGDISSRLEGLGMDSVPSIKLEDPDKKREPTEYFKHARKIEVD